MTAKSGIRALRPTHLVALRALDNRGTVAELTAPSWPRVADGDGSLPLWSLLSHAMAHSTGLRRAWVHLADDAIDGIAIARVRCGGLVWDVRHLWVDGEPGGGAQELLVRVCEEAAGHGARRVFLETGQSPDELSIARRAGFEQYTESVLHVRRGGALPDADSWPGARPRRRRDEFPLFQLYTCSVPAPVRSAEALTLEEWVALHKGSRRWAPGLLTNRQQQVWPLEEALIAWLEIAYGPKSQHAEWLVHPAHEALCDGLVAQATQLASPKVPLYATSRVYQQSLGSALSRAGFEVVAERAVFVRQLAIRIPERALVAVRARPTLGG